MAPAATLEIWDSDSHPSPLGQHGSPPPTPPATTSLLTLPSQLRAILIPQETLSHPLQETAGVLGRKSNPSPPSRAS